MISDFHSFSNYFFSSMSNDSAVDRFKYFHPDLATAVGLGDNPELCKLLEEASDFFHRHEIRPSTDKSVSFDSQTTHTVYGGSIRTWFCSISGKFKIDTCESISKLFLITSQLFRARCPLYIVECKRPDLPLFPLYLDIDILVENQEQDDLIKTERELLGSGKSGFPLFVSLLRILKSVYSPDLVELYDVFVSSATGGSKISWRIVYPNIIVNSERLGVLRDYIVSKLNHLSTRKEEVELKEIKEKLLALSANNLFRKIIDESAAKSRHGIRMVFNDKVSVSDGRLENRPFAPLVVLKGEKKDDDEKILNLAEITETVDDMDWSQKNSLLWPSLTHRELTEWVRQPTVRSSANIRTGPGGSSLCLSLMTVGDAIRAANRFQVRNESNGKKSCSAIYKWEEGTVSSFQKRLPIGISGKFDQEGSKCTWMLQPPEQDGETNFSKSSVSFDESTFVLTVLSIDADEFRYLTRMISRRFPNVEPSIPQAAATVAAAPKVIEAKKKIFKVLKTYRGEEPGELDVDEGEQVEIVNIDSSGWTAVKSDKSGKVGYVPATFIREEM